MLHNLALPEIRELIDAEDYDTLRDVLHDWLAADVAAVLNRLAPRERQRVFGLLGTHQAAETFEYLDVGFQQELLASLDDAAAAAVLNDMSPDDRTALFEDLPHETSLRLLPLLSAEQQQITRSLLSYGKGHRRPADDARLYCGQKASGPSSTCWTMFVHTARTARP